MSKGENLGELEQVILLAVARLGDRAYATAVGQEILERTEREVSPAAIHVTLGRLERKRLVRVRAGFGDAGMGNRPRKLYRVTLEGVVELQSVRLAQARLWEGLPFDPRRAVAG